jgi:hypothetical protein
MSALRRLARLSATERRLLAETLLLLLWIRLWLPFAGVDRLEAWTKPARTRSQALGTIVWAVRACARRMPGTTCLPAALVLQRLVAAAGHASELHVGVAQQTGRLAAHAWVVRDGEVLIGEEMEAGHARLLVWK